MCLRLNKIVHSRNRMSQYKLVLDSYPLSRYKSSRQSNNYWLRTKDTQE
jgi:hypothetical protein